MERIWLWDSIILAIVMVYTDTTIIIDYIIRCRCVIFLSFFFLRSLHIWRTYRHSNFPNRWFTAGASHGRSYAYLFIIYFFLSFFSFRPFPFSSKGVTRHTHGKFDLRLYIHAYKYDIKVYRTYYNVYK